MRKILYVFIVSVFCILSMNLCKAENLGTKIPGDSVRLFMVCYDTTIYPTLATPDSVSWYRYRAGIFLDSTNHLVPTAVKTGIIIKTYAARIDSLGEFYVIGRVKKGGKEAAKTWTYKVGYDSTHVKSLPDSILTRAKFKDLCFDSSAFTSTFWTDIRRLNTLASGQTFNNTGTWTGSITRADSVVAVNRLWDNRDTTNYLLASTQTFNNTGTWTGSITRADSVVAVNRLWDNKDTTNYLLASNEYINFWNVAFGASFTIGSMGDSLSNPSYVQGAAPTLTAANIWSYSSRTLTSDFAQLQVFYRTGVYGLEDSIRVSSGGVLKYTIKNYWYGFRLDSTRVINY